MVQYLPILKAESPLNPTESDCLFDLVDDEKQIVKHLQFIEAYDVQLLSSYKIVGVVKGAGQVVWEAQEFLKDFDSKEDYDGGVYQPNKGKTKRQ